MPNGSADTTGISSSVERSSVSAPPIASSEVEAKNAVPFCSAAMICMSTMRISRAEHAPHPVLAVAVHARR